MKGFSKALPKHFLWHLLFRILHFLCHNYWDTYFLLFYVYMNYVFYWIISFLKVSWLSTWTMKDGRNLDRWRREDLSIGEKQHKPRSSGQKEQGAFSGMVSRFICLVWRIYEQSRRGWSWENRNNRLCWASQIGLSVAHFGQFIYKEGSVRVGGECIYSTVHLSYFQIIPQKKRGPML